MSTAARAVLLLTLVTSPASAGDEPVKLWSQLKEFLGESVPSAVWPNPPQNVEAADDFDVVGTIERIFVGTEICFPCPYPDVVGAWVRFYEWDDGEPGALQHAQFVPLPSQISSLGVEFFLPEPFLASGKHFVSIQLSSTNSHGWAWMEANPDEPVLSTVRFRDNLGSGEWAAYLGNGGVEQYSDLAFDLWGTDLSEPLPLEPDPCGTWETLATPVPSGSVKTILRDVAVVAHDDAWAVGEKTDAATQIGRPLATRWDGQVWSEVPMPAGTPLANGVATLDAVAAVAPDDVWAAGVREIANVGGFIGPDVLIMHWDGSSWSVLDVTVNIPGVQSSNVIGIEVVAEDDIWFLGNGASTGCNPALALHYDGSSFTIEPTPCPPECGSGGLGGYALEAASAIAPDDVWAVGGGTSYFDSICSYVIHWDGRGWELVPSPTPGITRRLYDVEALAPDDVWAVGSYLDGLGYHVYAIHWDGSSWTTETLPAGGSALHAFGPDDIYAVGGGVSHYDGESWSLVQTFDGGVSLLGADAADPCRLFVAGRDVAGGDLVPFTARHAGDAVWIDTGAALSGAAGEPSLTGVGALVAGASTTLTLESAAGSATHALVIGGSQLGAPFKGGVLVPSPDIVVFGLQTDAAGTHSLSASWPGGLAPATEIVFQAWISDAAGPASWSASNGLRAVTP